MTNFRTKSNETSFLQEGEKEYQFCLSTVLIPLNPSIRHLITTLYTKSNLVLHFNMWFSSLFTDSWELCWKVLNVTHHLNLCYRVLTHCLASHNTEKRLTGKYKSWIYGFETCYNETGTAHPNRTRIIIINVWYGFPPGATAPVSFHHFNQCRKRVSPHF